MSKLSAHHGQSWQKLLFMKSDGDFSEPTQPKTMGAHSSSKKTGSPPNKINSIAFQTDRFVKPRAETE